MNWLLSSPLKNFVVSPSFWNSPPKWMFHDPYFVVPPSGRHDYQQC
jgi:hypothetical protein